MKSATSCPACGGLISGTHTLFGVWRQLLAWSLAGCARLATSTTLKLVLKKGKKEFVAYRLVCSSKGCFFNTSPLVAVSGR